MENLQRARCSPFVISKVLAARTFLFCCHLWRQKPLQILKGVTARTNCTSYSTNRKIHKLLLTVLEIEDYYVDTHSLILNLNTRIELN